MQFQAWPTWDQGHSQSVIVIGISPAAIAQTGSKMAGFAQASQSTREKEDSATALTTHSHSNMNIAGKPGRIVVGNAHGHEGTQFGGRRQTAKWT